MKTIIISVLGLRVTNIVYSGKGVEKEQERTKREKGTETEYLVVHYASNGGICMRLGQDMSRNLDWDHRVVSGP